MSSISSLGSGSSNNSYYQQASTVQRHGRDPGKVADNVFSKLDTKNQGYLEVSDLETAFGNIAQTGSSNSSTSGSSGSSGSSNTDSVNALFKKLDSDGDGKVTKSEFSDGIKKLGEALDSQFNARRTSHAEGSRPPPPPPGGGADDAGLDKTQLAGLATEVGKNNSSAGAALTQVAQNFDAADTNQDGKVSLQETLAYLEKSLSATGQTSSTSTTGSSASSSATGTGSSTSNASNSVSSASTESASSSTDAALFKKALQLLRAYSAPSAAGVSSTSTSQGISVSA